MKTILDCQHCERNSDTCDFACLNSAAAPVPDSALASSGVAAPSRAYYVILVDGLFVAHLDPIRFDYSLTTTSSMARKFSTPLQLKYLGKFTDFLERHHRPFEIQVFRGQSK